MERKKLEPTHLFPEVQSQDHDCLVCTDQAACSVLIMIGIAEATRLGQPDVALYGAQTMAKVLESWIERRKTTPDAKRAVVGPADISDEQFEKIPEGSFFKA